MDRITHFRHTSFRYCIQSFNFPVMVNKVVFLGEGRVGKTSLILRYCFNKFDPDQPQTIGMHNFPQTVKLVGGPITLDIWVCFKFFVYCSLCLCFYLFSFRIQQDKNSLHITYPNTSPLSSILLATIL